MRGAWANLAYCARHPLARAALCAAILAIIALLVALSLRVSAASKQAELQAEIGERTQSLREAQRSRQLHESLVRVAGEIDVIERKLAYAATQGQLVDDFARLAARHKVSIVSEAYEEGRRDGELQSLNTELSVRGSYAAIRGLLLEIPSLRAWTEVREVLLERGRDPGSINGKIQLTTFRRASPAES